MRIFYDGAIFGIQSAGGVNRYVEKLIEHLPGDCRPHLVTTEPLKHRPSHPALETRVSAVPNAFAWSRPLSKHWSAWSCRRYLNAVRPDVVHPSYYATIARESLWRRSGAIVVTVYDLIHEKFREMLRGSEKQIRLKRRAVERADHLICISENTRRDLIECYGVPESRTSVVPIAADLSVPAGAADVPVGDRFLFVGSRAPYKNFDRLLQALARIRSSRPALGLDCVGPEFSSDERQRIAALGLTDAVASLGPVNDDLLVDAYRRSIALVYPSLYEGFGLPPLEAMRVGTPVICSGTSSLPEVVGDAALTVDPTDIDAIAERMSWLADDRSRREGLIEAGRRRANRFGWQRMADETAAVYRQVA